jgi:hypothetical protein
MASSERCCPSAPFFLLALLAIVGAVGFASLPHEWREPLGRSLLGMTAAAFALILGVLLMVLVEGVWSRFFALHVRPIRGACSYRGEIVYGWAMLGRDLQLITRRQGVGFQAYTLNARLFARSRTVRALQREGVPFVDVNCDAIGRGILRWGEQLELLPLLEMTGLLNPHHSVFGRNELAKPHDAKAWREFCNALWKIPNERPLALMLATQCVPFERERCVQNHRHS